MINELIYYLRLFKFLSLNLTKSFFYKYKYKRKIKDFEKKLKTRSQYLVILNVESIGSLASQINFFYKFSIAHNLSLEKDFYFLASDHKYCNEFFIKKICEIIEIHYDKNLYKFLMIYGGLKYFIRKNICIPFSNDFVNFMPDKNFPIKFSNAEIIKGNKILEKIGILNNRDLIGISYKNKMYWKEKNFNKEWDAYRDSSFDNLRPTINYLSQKGFNIVQLGDIEKKSKVDKNYFKLEGLSKNEREFIDIYIYTHTKFVIFGMQGLRSVAELFSVPILTHNALLTHWQSKGITLPKKFIDAKKNYVIPYSELIKRKVLTVNFEEGLKKIIFIEPFIFRDMLQFQIRKIDIHENTSSEILQATIEMINYVINKENLTKEEFENQEKFRNIFFSSDIYTNSIVNYGVNFGGLISIEYLKLNPEIFKNESTY